MMNLPILFHAEIYLYLD